MRDDDFLEKQIDDAKKERHHIRHYTAGECELCHRDSQHIAEDGLCETCHGRFKIEDVA